MFRKWLLTTVITGGLVAASSGGGAYAQSGKLLHPNSGWAVSKLAASGSGGQPYCALARRFNGNIILTVARNSADESSVAIDFQRQALESGRSYQVTLDPGFKQHRSYNVRPVSGKAMVVRLGQDYAFHDALNRSGKLSIDISGEEYKFHLPDFAEGQMELAGCLGGMVQPAAGNAGEPSQQPTPMPAMPAQPSPKVSQAPATPAHNSYGGQKLAQADVQMEAPAAPPVAAAPMETPRVSSAPEVSETELRSLREENTRLRNALERERRVYEDRFMKEGQNSSQVAELSERLQILERENKDLRNQIVNQSASAPKAPESTSVLACAPNEDDSRKSAAMASMASEMKSLRAENEQLKAANAGIDTNKTSDSTANAVAMDSLKSEVSMLRSENERLKKEIVQQQAEMALLQQEVETAKAEEPSVAQKDDAAQDAIIGRLTSRVKVLEEENRAMKEAQRQGAGGSTVSLAQLRSLEEQLRYTQEDRDSLAQKLANMQDGKGNELMTISSDNWNLEQATKRYNEAEIEIRRLSRQLAEQRTQCAGEKKELEYMLFDPEVANEQQISKLITLENKLDDISRRYREQENLHEAELQRVKSRANSASQEKLASLKADMAALAKEKDLLEQERDALVQEKDMANARLASVAQEKDATSQRLASVAKEQQAISQRLASAIQEKEAANQRLASVVQEKEQLEAGMNALKAEKQKAEQKIAALAQQKKAVEQGLLKKDQATQSEVEILGQEKMAMEAELEAIEQEKNELQGRVRTLEEDRMALLKEKRDVEEQRDRLSEEVAGMEASLASMETAAGAASSAPRQIKSQDKRAQIAQVSQKVVQPQPVQAEPIALQASVPSAVAVPQNESGHNVRESSAAAYEQSEKAALDQHSDEVAKTSYAVASNVSFSSPQQVGGLLNQARIPVQGNVKAEQISGGQAFSWDTGSLFGSAEQKPIESTAAFDRMVEAYIANTRSRCSGEFAAIPVMSDKHGDMRVSAYDIACITDDGGASASLMFYNQDGIFNSYAHETGMDSMDVAMDARDKLVDTLLRGNVAMR